MNYRLRRNQTPGQLPKIEMGAQCLAQCLGAASALQSDPRLILRQSRR